MIRSVQAVAGVLCLALVGCGGGSGPGPGPTAAPTPVPTPTPATLTITSGLTGEPVAGARVVVGAAELTTDATGQVRTAPGLRSTTLVDVIADGFFDRQTTLGHLETADDTLWPREGPGHLDEAFTEELVYTSSSIEDEHVPGAAALERWPTSQSEVAVALLGPSDDERYRPLDDHARAVVADAVATINASLGGRMRLLPPTVYSTPPTYSIRVRLFPEYDTCTQGNYAAVANLRGPVIRSVVITFCEARYAHDTSVTVHELGHGIGLRHSSNDGDLMYPGYNRVERPSEREVNVIHLMLQRPPGNAFPDNDRTAAAASSYPIEFACR